VAWHGGLAPVPKAGGVASAPVVLERVIPSRDATRNQPTGVAVSGDRLYLADPRRAVVDVLTRFGSRVATIGAGWLQTPVYVAVGPVDGRVYVSDRGRGLVAIYAADGTRLGVLTPEGVRARMPKGTSWRPLALGFAPDGVLYVADSSGDQHIAVFSPTGSRIGTIGADVPLGRSGRRLAFPNGIVATATEIVVADSNNGRLLIFDRTGAFMRAIPVDGLPRGLAVLADGRIVVTDATTDLVTVYTVAGRPQITIGGSGPASARFTAPAGAAVDPEGRVYIGDSGSGAVQVLRTTPPGAGATGRGAAGMDVGLMAVAVTAGVLALGMVLFAATRARTRARGRARAL
jgi:DNA-binding beta-propeller fold protein YncE